MNMISDIDHYIKGAREAADEIITNIVFMGQVPAPTFEEDERVNLFMERLSEFQINECTTDSFNNPIGIIHGNSRKKPPIFVVAHMDTAFSKEVDHNYTVEPNAITGAGITDNALGVGILVSLPEILRRLDLEFESDIVLAGVTQSIGKGNLRGIRHLIRSWPTPIRGAICIESGELGRLNFYSEAMIRCEIVCRIPSSQRKSGQHQSNAILALNNAISRILDFELPLQPRARIIFGTISGGLKHGQIPDTASLGLELRSDSGKMVGRLYTDIKAVLETLAPELSVELDLKIISNVRAAKLEEAHPLVRAAVSIMDRLGIQPVTGPSESELSIFLSHMIPALTLGISHGSGYQKTQATMQIDPIFKGIAQIVAVLKAVDNGVCDA
jgi:acetylornithine deacetylase/succinyl-diaminopimelate desuccinylase-like protein